MYVGDRQQGSSLGFGSKSVCVCVYNTIESTEVYLENKKASY